MAIENLEAHEYDYGRNAVRCILSDERWTALPWPAYDEMARHMATKGEVLQAESLGRPVYMLPKQGDEEQRDG